MDSMALILLSGSWTLIFLVLGMYAFILGVPIALIIWLVKKLKKRKPSLH
jgi:cytochrome c biogenesis protein CcdA